MDAWRWMTATDLGQGISKGEIDPVDLTEVFLDAIEKHDLRDRIYARVTPERARSEARAAQVRAKTGRRLSPLDGVPISWKDLFDTAGIVTEAGTKLLEGRTPESDALVLERATAAGLVCLGKTHMSEIAFSGLGLNPVMETPPCVNDPDAVPGGSSSGAGASVAFGLAAAGIGSDTGGSVRVPSAWNDLTGLKTTHGRLPLDGVVPLCLTFDTVGPLCRSITDCATLFAIMNESPVVDIKGAQLDGMHFAVLKTIAMDNVRDEPNAAFDAAVAKLVEAGATVSAIEVPELADAFDLAGPLYGADSYGAWHELVEAHPEKMFPQILERVRGGKAVTGASYVAGWIKLREIRAKFAKAIAEFDAVLTPTTPILPPNLNRLQRDDDYYRTENLLALRNTRVANLMNLPAITLPTGTPSCGLMLNGHNGKDERLIRIGAAAEVALA